MFCQIMYVPGATERTGERQVYDCFFQTIPVLQIIVPILTCVDDRMTEHRQVISWRYRHGRR